MEKEWLTGNDVIHELGIYDVEIVKLVQNGLQPYDEFMQKMLPPSVGELYHLVRELKEDIFEIEKDFPGIKEVDVNDWYVLHHDRHFDMSGNLEEVSLPCGIGSEIIENYMTKKAQLKRSESKLEKYPDLPLWKGYELPRRSKDRKSSMNLVLNALYRYEDVRKMDVHFTEPESNVESKIQDAEEFIKFLKVSCVSDTEISLKVDDKKAETFTCKDMGFKANSKTWQLLIDVLQRSDHEYHVGIYSASKNPVQNRNYNKLVKRLDNFSEKFISFLNDEYPVSLPEGFNVFENMKGRKRAGTYKPKFEIVDMLVAINSTDIKDMSKEETIKKLKRLSELRKREKDQHKKDHLLKEIGHYAEHASKKGWITRKQLSDLISLPDEAPSSEDAMSQAVQVEKINKF